MTRKRQRPVLGTPLGPKGRKALATRVKAINAKGDAARERIAARTGKAPGKAPAKRAVASAAGIEREIARTEARVDGLLARGAYTEADQAGRTLAGLVTRKRRADRAKAQAETRRARLDRFALLVQRSAVLTDWHEEVADRWLAAMDAAADGLLQRAAVPDEAPDEELPARDPVTGRRAKPELEGAAIYLRGRSVLDRWKKAVPVSSVELHGRKVPATFDPKAVKAARRAPGDGMPAQALAKREKADRLSLAFSAALEAAGHPAWCEAVAIRVIRHNEGVVASMKALGISHWAKTQEQLCTAMAAGLSGVALALGMAVDK